MDNVTLGYVLIGIGFLCLMGELVVAAHGGLIAAAIFVDIVGVGMVFYYGDRFRGFAALAGVTLLVPLFTGFMYYVWPHTPMGRRLLLRGQTERQDVVTTLPAVAELEALKGRIGKAISPLRPSGAAEFDGRRVDCLSEGPMIEPGYWVRCVDVKGGKVVVRPIDDPSLADLENATFN